MHVNDVRFMPMDAHLLNYPAVPKELLLLPDMTEVVSDRILHTLVCTYTFRPPV